MPAATASKGQVSEQGAASTRFETHVNYAPERAEVPKLSQAVVDFLGKQGEVNLFL